MVRSFHYAAHAGLPTGGDRVRWESLAESWSREIGGVFLESWRAQVSGSGLCPGSEKEFRLLLDAYLIEKSVYEVRYELNNRPAWLPIPLRGILTPGHSHAAPRSGGFPG
jgi:maltose alpha-D-glucosyltransferase / alpha-amylase